MQVADGHIAPQPSTYTVCLSKIKGNSSNVEVIVKLYANIDSNWSRPSNVLVTILPQLIELESTAPLRGRFYFPPDQ